MKPLPAPYFVVVAFVLFSLLLPINAAFAGCCGGSIVVELAPQHVNQVTVLVGKTEIEVKVFNDPTPIAEYDYYICFCNLPHLGTDCYWGHKISLYDQRPDQVEPGCGWITLDHREASACDIINPPCNP
jgi:hypothetical protein